MTARAIMAVTLGTAASLLVPAAFLAPTANAGYMDRYCTPNANGSGPVARVSLEFSQVTPGANSWRSLKLSRRSWAISGPHRAVKWDAPAIGKIFQTGSRIPVTIKWKRTKGGAYHQCSVSIRVYSSDISSA